MKGNKAARPGIVLLAIVALVLGSTAIAFADAPSNDNFADATQLGSVPSSGNADTSEATLEANEPIPCTGYSFNSVWWAFTAPEAGSFAAQLDPPYPWIVAYTGAALTNLKQVAGGCYTTGMTFQANAGETIYIQVLSTYYSLGAVNLSIDVAPMPVADFYYDPNDPSTFDTIQFYDNSWDPGNGRITSQVWDFGDGGTTTSWDATHQYAATGDYTVQLSVSTEDGRTASTSRVVTVANHDVALARFGAPKTGRVGQTSKIAVSVASKLTAETVQIDLYKSIPGISDSFQWLGGQQLLVPARSSKRTVTVNFNYTFTSDDARVGKVTFKAVAVIVGWRDALPGDNEMRATARVSR